MSSHLEVIPDEEVGRERELEENLDYADPLRHLMHGADDFSDDGEGDDGPHADATVLPAQRPSILGDTITLTFPDSVAHVGATPVNVRLKVDASPGCGGMHWPAGQTLGNYLAWRGASALAGRTIVELGAGTGLVGFVAGALGGNVLITDQAPLLPLMRENTALNGLEDRVKVAELNWGEPLPEELQEKVDMVLAADCVYFEPAFPLLVQTLFDLVHEDTEVLFCYKKRRKADKRFFNLLKKHFTWSEVTDDPARPIYNKDAISLFRLHRRH
ncbi:S-adenosyl-L-methionine-dependent methyltransferase [Schizophyllum commune H4-8]|uniref:Protein-lysine N-methyltransferase EFM6 n=1 Tax=Schizophyllum commune (strain H4-8 / FGSC 9210) TaxID=578458 RepID=D8PKW2_SCHCM|nr:S-adenosyl-L-methionine-dependent methyltransferase [Schizophyllum commune H4-8]KAI5894215.1 S-adenosyl-L-methionine-dependent methyltransferase [Schizophyllum commune H4-8]